MTSLLSSTLERIMMTQLRRDGQRWCHVLPHLHARYGGLSTTVPALTDALRAEAISCSVAAFCKPEDGDRSHHSPQSSAVRYWTPGRLAWICDRTLSAGLREAVSHYHGVHIHGLWDQGSLAAAGAALQTGRPYVLSAHGMLEPWALHAKKWKKAAYSSLLQRNVVRGAACLHALTRAEAQHYFDYLGARQPVAVIPNGIAVPEGISPELFTTQFPSTAGKRVVLFLGRLHPKKGVDLLMDAWLQVEGYADAVLVLAGPDADGMRAQLEDAAARRNMQHRVLFTGMLDSDSKWSALAAAECMVLPSHSEGLSVSVLEALAMGVPVLLTPQCHMPEVEAANAGWLVEPRVTDLQRALTMILSRGPERNAETGAQGAILAESMYGWGKVATAMAEVYRWVTGGPAPETCEVIQ